MLIYEDEEKTILKLNYDKQKNNNPEEQISDRLAIELDGEREVMLNLTSHRIDVLTKEYIIEVKSYHNRIKALGQLLYYQNNYPDKKLWVHLFDHNNNRDKNYTETCERNNIKLTYE